MRRKPRVLHFITVYNGRAFVPRAIESALGIDQSDAEIDVLVLDDKSPEPGWSDELSKICKSLGAQYYCTPRNLGIPRNCSLGLMTALRKGYDYVVINNSDTIFPKNLTSEQIAIASQPGVGSVTAWSNNVSLFSLPNEDPDHHLAEQSTVDWVSTTLARQFKGRKPFALPVGISFCIMMPTKVVAEIGVMDPVFGRGYCEETDWSLRSIDAGYKCVLAPTAFVYHQGRGSNVLAGLVSGALTTVPENEAIIDLRYPDFRKQVASFEAAKAQDSLNDEAVRCLLRQALTDFGHAMVPDHPVRNKSLTPRVDISLITQRLEPRLKLSYRGFETTIDFPHSDVEALIREFKASPARKNAPAKPAVKPVPAEAISAYAHLKGWPYPHSVL